MPLLNATWFMKMGGRLWMWIRDTPVWSDATPSLWEHRWHASTTHSATIKWGKRHDPCISGGVLKRVIYKPTDTLDRVVGWHTRVFGRKVACARLATPPFTRRVINACHISSFKINVYSVLADFLMDPLYFSFNSIDMILCFRIFKY
jgi:hypothetical protein